MSCERCQKSCAENGKLFCKESSPASVWLELDAGEEPKYRGQVFETSNKRLLVVAVWPEVAPDDSCYNFAQKM